MSSAAVKRLRPSEYLAFERASRTKHEFFDGEVFAMAGGSASHNLIAVNLAGELRNALKDGPCRVFSSDMRVLCPTGLRTYPDISVCCGEPKYEDEQQDTLLNPLVIIEVLSPTTEKYDRVKKFEHYRSIPSLREYVVVASDRQVVEHYSRQADAAHWLLTISQTPGETVRFPALGCSVEISEVYAKVQLPPHNAALHDTDGSDLEAGPR